MTTEGDRDDELSKILERKARELAKVTSGGGLVELNDEVFDEFVKSHEVAVVDFWAPWCAPCFLLEPIMKSLAAAMPNVAFGRLNTQEFPDVAARFGVMSLPTVIIFKGGEPVDFVVGAVPRKVLENKIRRVLGE
ncbi:thioredoxin family protein [Vulcanisaeta thermophila]|uniref:thioredoxin family protein n=1 Tax=Vulcanisaeta thermophila TaxID=867917 RepID=UPI0008531342|nr:thioredoxin family protein [Vulcanisaeta thermophila]